MIFIHIIPGIYPPPGKWEHVCIGKLSIFLSGSFIKCPDCGEKQEGHKITWK